MRGCFLPRKTDSNNPADWLWISASDLEGIRVLAERELSHAMCLGKLAEVLEKILKAELIRIGWPLEKTHDLRKLASELQLRQSDVLAKIRPVVEELAESYFLSRYPGFDLDDPDWPAFRKQVEQVTALLAVVKARVAGPAGPSS